MDRNIRELERAWRINRDTATHARLLSALIKSGMLAQKHVDLAAFLDHPAARLCAKVVDNGVISDGYLARNVEMKELMHNLGYWGIHCLRLAGLAITRIAMDSVRAQDRYEDGPCNLIPYSIFDAIENFVYSPANGRDVLASQNFSAYSIGRFTSSASIINEIGRAMLDDNKVLFNVIKSIYIFYPDMVIRSYLQREICPWALKNYA